ncbi:hypothetical protein [Desulfoglaeba alkanexedens]|nr:hypothetical protein [Desulfoglaeba alkanexedens]
MKNYASKIAKDEVRVLDVGSYDVNGSYRHLFDDPKYQYTAISGAPVKP